MWPTASGAATLSRSEVCEEGMPRDMNRWQTVACHPRTRCFLTRETNGDSTTNLSGKNLGQTGNGYLLIPLTLGRENEIAWRAPVTVTAPRSVATLGPRTPIPLWHWWSVFHGTALSTPVEEDKKKRKR